MYIKRGCKSSPFLFQTFKKDIAFFKNDREEKNNALYYDPTGYNQNEG